MLCKQFQMPSKIMFPCRIRQLGSQCFLSFRRCRIPLLKNDPTYLQLRAMATMSNIWNVLSTSSKSPWVLLQHWLLPCASLKNHPLHLSHLSWCFYEQGIKIPFLCLPHRGIPASKILLNTTTFSELLWWDCDPMPLSKSIAMWILHKIENNLNKISRQYVPKW